MGRGSIAANACSHAKLKARLTKSSRNLSRDVTEYERSRQRDAIRRMSIINVGTIAQYIALY